MYNFRKNILNKTEYFIYKEDKIMLSLNTMDFDSEEEAISFLEKTCETLNKQKLRF